MFVFEEAEKTHFKKRCDELRCTGLKRSAESIINTALLDNDTERIKKVTEILNDKGYDFRTESFLSYVKNPGRMRLTYLLPDTRICGAVKLLIEQANRLAGRGFQVAVYSHFPDPSWIKCKVPFFQVHPDSRLSDLVVSADIVVAGRWDCVTDALRINSPIKYLFADWGNEIFEMTNLTDEMRKAVAAAFTMPVRILSGTDKISEILKKNFSRKCAVVRNGIERAVFHRRRPSQTNEVLKITITGDDTGKSNGNEMIAGALYCMSEMGYTFSVNWLTPKKLQRNYSLKGLEIKVDVRLSQEKMADALRQADIHICGNLYGPFAVAPLEAVSCGAALLTSDNSGVKAYAKNGCNCLMYEPGNVYQMAENLKKLFDDQALRKQLQKNGRITAERFSLSKTARSYEKEFRNSTLLKKAVISDPWNRQSAVQKC